jgi:hypothetical protein
MLGVPSEPLSLQVVHDMVLPIVVAGGIPLGIAAAGCMARTGVGDLTSTNSNGGHSLEKSWAMSSR